MKTAFILLIIFLANIQNDLLTQNINIWNEIINESNLEKRMILLKEYIHKFGNNKNTNTITMYLYLNLATTSYQLKNYENVISNGEKVLKFNCFQKMTDTIKTKLYFYLAYSYYILKKDFAKSYQYADLLIKISQAIREEHNPADKPNINIIVSAYQIQSSLLYNQGQKNPKKIKLALEKAIEAYKMDGSRINAEFIEKVAILLYDRFKLNTEAKNALSFLLDSQQNPKQKLLNILASWYLNENNYVKAIEYFEKSFKISKKSKTAYIIGIIYLKNKDSNNAMNFFAKAYVLDLYNQDTVHLKKSEKVLRPLFYNIGYINITHEELDKRFHDYLNKIRSELGINEVPPKS
jgi:tetratricopeptide (TPR) repeat protein